MRNLCMIIFLSLLILDSSLAKNDEFAVRPAPVLMRSLNCSDQSGILQRVETPNVGGFDFKWIYDGKPISSIVYSNPHPSRIIVVVNEPTRSHVSVEQTDVSIVEKYTVEVEIKESSRFSSRIIKEFNLTCLDTKYFRMPNLENSAVPRVQ